MSGKRLLLVGDMVWGMADVTTPYVGQIVDQSAGAPPQTAAMESASAPSSGGGCVMTINGLPVAHAGCMSVATPPLPQAKPIAFCTGMSLNGKPLLVELGQFMASPSGSLSSSAVTQQSVRISKAVSGPSGGDFDSAAAPGGSAAGGGPPVRTNFDSPSAEHVMASRVSSSRLADLLPEALAHRVGDPVDVSTGAVVTGQVDDRSAKYDLVFDRRYNSRRSGREGVLGAGWSHNFDQSVWLEEGRIVLGDAGREIEFDTLDLLDRVARPGTVLRDPTGRLRLTAHGRNAWELHDGECTRYFLPMPGTSGRDKDRGLSRLSSIARPGLPLVELHYDDHARLTSVRCNGEAVFTLRYHRDGLLESLNDRVMRYGYSAAGDLIEARDLDGNARLYDYSSHLLVRETNRRGGAFYYGYDGHEPSSRCVRTWGDGGRLHRMIAYEGSTTLVTNSLGERTAYALSPIGLVKGVTGPDGYEIAYEHDDQLRLIAVRRGEHRAVDRYDEGRVVKHRARDGAIWQMEYDHGGRLVGGTDPVGGRWGFAYDLDGQLTRVEDPEQHVYRMEYAQGRLTKVIDPLGRVVEVSLGLADEVLEISAPWQPDVKFEYDHSGRLTAAVTQSGDEARWYYDALGQLVGAMRGGELVQWRRDPEGSITQAQSDAWLETYARDAFGRLLRRHGDGVDITYRYDTEDQCVSAAREGGPRIEFEHDVAGRVSRYTIDGSSSTEVERDDDAGTIAKLISADGTVALSWDAGERLTACQDAKGKRAYTYREDGLLASFSTESHACSIQRNALGVVLEQNYVDRVVSSKDVDHRGNRYGVEVSDGPSLFYLWASGGTLERIGLVGDMPFEIDLEIAPDASRGVASSTEGRAEYDNLSHPRPVSIATPGQDHDALFRPLQTADGESLLWDEDRVLASGASVGVYAIPAGTRLGTVRGEAFAFAEPEDAAIEHFGLDATVAACCLAPDEPQRAFELTPWAFLGHAFDRRVWDETPRPVAGRLPWNPDAWAPASPEPDVGPLRLDQETLMRLLSPFPAPRLSVISEA
jgi:YD repeat-containing protein